MKSRRANQVKIGAFVVGGLAILVAAVVLIGTGRLFRSTHSFVSYFEGSVNGLRAGAPVKFKGVELGNVSRIRIPYWLEQADPPIAVFFGLDGDKLERVEGGGAPTEEMLRRAIRQGLRAQLETDSVVTGVMHVSLSIVPESEARLHDPIEGVLEIPTIPPPLQEIGAAIRTLVDRVSRLELEALFESMRNALDGVSELTRAPEVRGVLSSLEQTLVDLQGMIRGMDPLTKELLALVQRTDALASELQPGVGSARVTLESVEGLAQELRTSLPPLVTGLTDAFVHLQAASASMEAAMDSTRTLLDPDAPIAFELRQSLEELAGTVRAARLLLELLERDPAALVRGKSAQEGEPR